MGRKTRMNNPPTYLLSLFQREVYAEGYNAKRNYNNKNQNQNQNRNKNENLHNNEKDDFTIERSQNFPQNNPNVPEVHDNLFFREPDDKKKSEIKNQLHKWTKHFKEIGKNENVKIMNSMRMNLNILTPDNFAKIRLIIVDLVKSNEENLKTLVDMIIEKAWNEPKYITTYASLCSYLQDEKSLQTPTEKTGEDGKKTKNKSLFKSFLLGRIQKAFEKQEFLKEKGKKIVCLLIKRLEI